MSKSIRNVATERDVEEGRAVFHVPEGRSEPFDLGRPLPTAGILLNDVGSTNGDDEAIPSGTSITILQAELVDGNVILGFKCDRGVGVAALEEISLV